MLLHCTFSSTMVSRACTPGLGPCNVLFWYRITVGRHQVSPGATAKATSKTVTVAVICFCLFIPCRLEKTTMALAKGIKGSAEHFWLTRKTATYAIAN